MPDPTAPANHPLVQLVRLGKAFPAPGRDEPLTVLDSIDLDVQPGDTLAIVGPSGSGKSTLLNLIGALDRPTAGQVLLEGQDLAQLASKDLARLRNRRIGFVFQLHHLLDACTVLENVLVPTLAHANRTDRDARDRAENLLERVGLADRLHHRPARLSGGERQRTALVRALVNEPDLLLLDEPTGSLDHRTADDLTRLLVELNRERRVTLILATHALDLAAAMGHVLHLRQGRLTPPEAAR